MKTVINTKIIFESDKFHGVYFDEAKEVNILTMNKLAGVLRSGDYELVEVVQNELMNNAELTLVIRHKYD